MYGSSFCIRTAQAALFEQHADRALVSPLPSELTTPPVTKICLAMIATAFLANALGSIKRKMKANLINDTVQRAGNHGVTAAVV